MPCCPRLPALPRPWLALAGLGLALTFALGLAGCERKGGPSGGSPPGGEQPVDVEDGGVPDGGGLPGDGVGLTVRPSNPTCLAPPRPVVADGVVVQPAFPLLHFVEPLLALQAPEDASRVFVLERQGKVLVFSNDAQASTTRVFVDLTSRVESEQSQEVGLLGMAFHPRFATTGEVFLSYVTVREGRLTSVISRFLSRDGGATLDPTSEEEVLSQDQSRVNHKGGNLAFGPDGYLYFAFGDGGGPEDPDRNGQNTNVLLGKMLRLDVDGARPYAIPPTNPLQEGEGRREIYAWGFRNPWRWSFDRLTGELWLADVGQDTWEEVDVVVRGGNYGWSEMEGNACLRDDACTRDAYIPPVAVYSHAEGVSITGGYVYRGSAIPSLSGRYVYGDFGNGRIWALEDAQDGTRVPRVLVDSGAAISSFGELHDGELLVVDFGGGQLLRLAPPPVGGGGELPQLLSQTGCVDSSFPQRPAPGLVPYTVNAPLWSDGADKERFLALPDGTSLQQGPEGRWQLPPGGVLMKTFLLGDRRVETRLFMRHPDGSYAGYTYEWNDAQTDAQLLTGSKTTTVDGHTWNFPSRAECMECHNAAAGFVLGLETAQLNGALDYPGGQRANQVKTLAHLGMLTLPGAQSPEALPQLAAPFGSAPLEARARAYLHANCSHCHRPAGLGRGTADLRATTALARAGVCNVAPQVGDLGVAGAKLLLPGHPEASLLPLRMRALDAHRMPPLATRLVDSEGVALVEAWIASLSGCPAAP